MNERRKKIVTRMLVALVALWVVAQAVVSWARHVHDREARQEAEVWLLRAQQVANRDLTPADAVQWFEQSETKPFRGETVWVNGKVIPEHVIEGYRKFSKKGLLSDPLTARLVFHFDTDWHFTKVDVELLSYEFDPNK